MVYPLTVFMVRQRRVRCLAVQTVAANGPERALVGRSRATSQLPQSGLSLDASVPLARTALIAFDANMKHPLALL
jgi:hypothetical protein